MKKTLMKYLCVGLVWSFLIVVACVSAHFYDLNASGGWSNMNYCFR